MHYHKAAKYLFFGNFALNEVTEGLQCACSRIIYNLWTESKLRRISRGIKEWAALGELVQERAWHSIWHHAGGPGISAIIAYLHIVRGCLTIGTACFQELGQTIQCTLSIVLNNLMIVGMLNEGKFYFIIYQNFNFLPT